MKTCASCGRADVAAAARFCPECGAALAAPEPPPESPPGPSTATHIDVRQDVGSLEGGKATGVELGGVSGDVTVQQHGDTFAVNLGDVGAGAQLAVGKQISQTGAGAAGLSAADRSDLAAGLAALKAAVHEPAVPASRQMLAQEFVSQLEIQLTGDEPPDGATIKVAGDWLLNNVPALAPALRALFEGPAGARALAAAGEPAVGWATARLRA